MKDRVKFLTLEKPSEARRLGQKLVFREDWEKVKISVMRDLVSQKFQCPVLKAKLLSTGSKLLEETNSWGDTFWGVCNGIGSNHLGLILMEIRKELDRGQ